MLGVYEFALHLRPNVSGSVLCPPRGTEFRIVAVSMRFLIAWLAGFVILGGHQSGVLWQGGEAGRVVHTDAQVGRQQRVLDG
jgi:hypothetical protein